MKIEPEQEKIEIEMDELIQRYLRNKNVGEDITPHQQVYYDNLILKLSIVLSDIINQNKKVVEK